MNTKHVLVAASFSLVALVAGCSTWSEMPRSEKGTAVGAGGGALVGAAVGGPVGAVVGAGVGGYAGHYEAKDVGHGGNVNRTASAPIDSRTGVAEASPDRVRAAQQALADRGFNPGPADGVMGPSTEQALRSFQQREGIAVTGDLDATTAQHLNVAH